MGKPEKESKKEKKDKKEKKEKESKKVKAEAATPAKADKEEKEFDYNAMLKRCTIISKPMASEKLTKKVMKTTKKGRNRDIVFTLHPCIWSRIVFPVPVCQVILLY